MLSTGDLMLLCRSLALISVNAWLRYYVVNEQGYSTDLVVSEQGYSTDLVMKMTNIDI